MLGCRRSRASSLCGCGATSPQLMRMGWGRAETSAAVIPSPRNGGMERYSCNTRGQSQRRPRRDPRRPGARPTFCKKYRLGRSGETLECFAAHAAVAEPRCSTSFATSHLISNRYAILTAQRSHAADRTRATVIGKGGPVAPVLLWSAAQPSLALGLLAATGTRSLTR